MRLVLAGNGPGRDFLPALPGRLRPVPGHVTCAGRDRRAGSRAAAAGGVSRRGCRCPAFTAGGLSAGLLGHGMTDARVACCVTIAVLAVLPFPLIFREKKELMGKERKLHDGCDGCGHGVRAALWRYGPGGEPGQRRCKRPGCGNLVPVSGRGRTRVFCGDACSRRFHNAARSPGGDGGGVSPGQAADPLGALEALIRQAGSLVTLARGQVAALDAEVVAAQLAEAEAARRRAEARAVTAEARAAEAEEEMLAALEAAEAAHRGREAAEAEARRAREETARARRELAEEAARARADAEAAAGPR